MAQIFTPKDFNKKLASFDKAVGKTADLVQELVVSAVSYALLAERGDNAGYQNDCSQIKSLVDVLDKHKVYAKAFGVCLREVGFSVAFSKKDGTVIKIGADLLAKQGDDAAIARMMVVERVEKTHIKDWNKSESVHAGFNLERAKATTTRNIMALIVDGGMTFAEVQAMLAEVITDEKVQAAKEAKIVVAQQ